MRKVIVSEFLTVDGVMEDPGGSEGTPSGGWSLQFFSEEYGKYKFDELFASGALLLGRITYQGFAAAWPTRTDEYGFADKMNSMPKFVVSATLREALWSNSKVIRGDVVGEVSALKQQPGKDILVVGSGQLVRTLMQHGLVDEFRLMIHPVVIGVGKRLFENGIGKKSLKLIETKTFSTGTIILVYQLATQEMNT